MMFRYAIHNQILQILKALNQSFLSDCQVYFGGGTMLTLAYGEYRLSRDIDFLCPYGQPFSQLRRAIYDYSYGVLFSTDQASQLQFPREIQTDRDGVRFTVEVEEVLLKLEIVAEGRISLNTPLRPDWSPVDCLSVVDQVTEKLMANSDRWADTTTDARDLIDLCILKLTTDIPEAAIQKAENVYRCVEPLQRAILNFQAKPEYRLRCYQRLQVLAPHQVIDGLDALSTQFGLPQCDRQAIELPP